MQRAAVLQFIVHLIIVRPLCAFILGLNVRRKELLPRHGPAVLIANHNSHLDTLVLMSLFPLRSLRRLRPVAAADYFLKTPLREWISRNIFGIIPISREGRMRDPFAEVTTALLEGAIVIIFPEGSRGTPEQRSPLKTGIAHLAKRFPTVPFIPVFMFGLGRSLPRGEFLLVPFFCDIFVGESINWTGDRDSFMTAVDGAMTALGSEADLTRWE